jgi:hypothetical protein
LSWDDFYCGAYLNMNLGANGSPPAPCGALSGAKKCRKNFWRRAGASSRYKALLQGGFVSKSNALIFGFGLIIPLGNLIGGLAALFGEVQPKPSISN